jgi:hypothetical protein
MFGFFKSKKQKEQEMAHFLSAMADINSRKSRLGQLTLEELQKVQKNIEVVKLNQIFSDDVEQLRGDYLWLEELEKALIEVNGVDVLGMDQQRFGLLKAMREEVPQLKKDVWAKYESVRGPQH